MLVGVAAPPQSATGGSRALGVGRGGMTAPARCPQRPR